ncbi:type II secretion system F family protein [Candidatus Woesearchaeota archaeon]|nr:type II secretion system F family protein [Candidatus Woesearchaeota archaeon]
MDIVHTILHFYPKVKTDLRMAYMKDRPDIYIKKSLKGAATFGMGMTIFFFFMFQTFKVNLIFLLPTFIILCIGFFHFFLLVPKQRILKRQRDLDREVLFAGRYLLVKLNSGVPLLNALLDASKSYGVAKQYFKEIVDEINLGTPIEKAIDNAVKYSPSVKFRKIMFQIGNAVKVGVDVSRSLSDTLEEITNEQMSDIQAYGKKLNSLALFYMLLAVVVPSLGMTIFIVIGTLVNFLTPDTAPRLFGVVLGFLVFIQFIFVSIFKTTRLSVNI